MNEYPISESVPSNRLWRWLSALCLGCAWAATAIMAVCVLLRLVWHDGNLGLVWINAFTVYFYLPAYVCLAWGLWQRKWWLAAVSLAIVAFHLSWVLPELLPTDRRTPASATDDPSETLRIFYANVLTGNSHYGPLLEEIADADPDLIFINEFSTAWEEAFAKSPVMQSYLQSGGLPRHRFGNMGFYSRLPVSDFQIVWLENRMSCTFDVMLDDEKLRLFCLHGPRPLDYAVTDYYRYWAAIQSLVAQQPEPLIVIGDFNATQFSRAYQQLTSGRLRSAHRDVGRGYATTWPNGLHVLPPIQIDHALLSPQVECLNIVEGRGTGSDHRPLILQVRLRAEE